MKNVAKVALLVAVSMPAAAAAEQYVLQAGKWGAGQKAAVEAAGGTVVWGHGKSGIGVATSDASDFLARAMGSGAFHSGEADVVVQWQMPSPIEQVVTETNETFWNLQWNMEAIEAPAAWAAGCTGDGVRVAVLDGGIHSTHVDLDGNLDVACSRSFTTGAFNTDTGTFWHGTHVAGIIAAEDNNIGTIGVAPDATIVGVKVLHGGTGSFGGVIGGILYASDPAAFGGAGCARADIINMSLGAEFPRAGAGSLVSALNKAVNFASSNGVLVVVAAGNSAIDYGQAGNLTTMPAEAGSAVAVSATGPIGYAVGWPNGNQEFRRPASYSNYGEGLIHVAAPGGDFALPGTATCSIPRTDAGSITTQCWVFDMVLSTSRGAGASTTSYSFAAGTSMASPAAAGVAALIKGANPSISLGALKSRLAQTADDEGPGGHDEFYGRGFVNAANACN